MTGLRLPGCAVPARWCAIDHVIHWAEGGSTSLTNCVALCGRHHRLVHHSDWRIDVTGGILEFPPTSLARRTPRRNPLHTTPKLIRFRE